MPISPLIRDVFVRFQDLNLLTLMDDLRVGRTARHGWLAGAWLCPIAHGLADGGQVSELHALGQAGGRDCVFAAHELNADPAAVERFVRSWDAEAISVDWLIRQLEALWQERLREADLLQARLQPVEPLRPQAIEAVDPCGMLSRYSA